MALSILLFYAGTFLAIPNKSVYDADKQLWYDEYPYSMEESAMNSRDELFNVLDNTFSPESARDFAVGLTDYYRAPGTSGFQIAMDQVESALRDAGLDVTVDEPVIEDAWEPNEASLSVVDPVHESLIDFDDAPACLAWGSSSTNGKEEFEIVNVGTGESPDDFEEQNVEGKVVYIHGTQRRPGWWEAAGNAVDAGARGIITDYMLYQTPGVREPELVPEAAQLLRLRPAERFIDEDVWAVSIPHDSAIVLDDLLERGSVTIEANIDVEVFDATAPYLEATIPGEVTDETILFCGHASGIKPGANCAEGTGLVVELARALNELADQYKFKRSIKFIVGVEGPVSEEYLKQNPDATEDVITSLTYCSTGHKQSETESCLLLSSSPDSVPHFTNDYLAELADQSPKEADWIGKEGGQELPLLNLSQHYYTPWSDNSRFAQHEIPAPLFMSWPDKCFHSQLLTADVIDPAALRRSALISGVAALELAIADKDEAAAIGRIVAGRSLQRLQSLGANYAMEATPRARRHVEYVKERDIKALNSVTELSDGAADTIDDLELQIQQTAEKVVDSFNDTKESNRGEIAELIPVRTTDDLVARWVGLEYNDLLEIADQLADADENAGWRSLRVVSDEAWNFVDGERTVGEIADAVGFEFEMTIHPEPVHRILKGHEDGGNLRFE
ncbi:hypothetical protein [Natronosalvus rutilus]|uniref:DUF4910 domain-containing protein n=1 Tax=Natronosalvus rutilus TaxID=2953753 RepID=A0A9E7NC33_9EURY|nr:hypothetical protein [Natronosalvus rutilus]UTF55709.1 hypothetical protein NGM29_18625 [Natronosalvus rutilus]